MNIRPIIWRQSLVKLSINWHYVTVNGCRILVSGSKSTKPFKSLCISILKSIQVKTSNKQLNNFLKYNFQISLTQRTKLSQP